MDKKISYDILITLTHFILFVWGRKMHSCSLYGVYNHLKVVSYSCQLEKANSSSLPTKKFSISENTNLKPFNTISRRLISLKGRSRSNFPFKIALMNCATWFHVFNPWSKLIMSDSGTNWLLSSVLPVSGKDCVLCSISKPPGNT